MVQWYNDTVHLTFYMAAMKLRVVIINCPEYVPLDACPEYVPLDVCQEYVPLDV